MILKNGKRQSVDEVAEFAKSTIDINKNVGYFLIIARKYLGLTLNNFAREVTISSDFYCKLEKIKSLYHSMFRDKRALKVIRFLYAKKVPFDYDYVCKIIERNIKNNKKDEPVKKKHEELNLNEQLQEKPVKKVLSEEMQKNLDGELSKAFENRIFSCVSELFNLGARVPKYENDSYLMIAINCCREDMVLMLLDNGANVNKLSFGKTPLDNVYKIILSFIRDSIYTNIDFKEDFLKKLGSIIAIHDLLVDRGAKTSTQLSQNCHEIYPVYKGIINLSKVLYNSFWNYISRQVLDLMRANQKYIDK